MLMWNQYLLFRLHGVFSPGDKPAVPPSSNYHGGASRFGKFTIKASAASCWKSTQVGF